MNNGELLEKLNMLTPEQRKAVEELVESFVPTQQEPPREKVSLRGKYKHVLTSSEEFCRRKQEEIDLEDRRWRK
ncbi:MAG: hypothetical protein ACYDCO_23525 [Armatimonadota bacterium]